MSLRGTKSRRNLKAGSERALQFQKEIAKFIPSDKTEIASASPRNDQPEIFLAVTSEGPARNDGNGIFQQSRITSI